MADETDIYFWTDRQERAYAVLRRRGGHWRVEWGDREPPGASTFLERGHHESSAREEVVRRLLDRVRDLSGEPDEAARVEQRLREAMAVVAAESRAERG
jgi:hypothetical protein